MTAEEFIEKGKKLERQAMKDLARATKKLERKAKKELPKAAAKLERRAKKEWKHLSKEERTFLVAGVVVQLTLLAAAQMDISRRDADQVRGKKWMWRLLVLISFVGPLAYFAFGRKRRAPLAEVAEIGDSAVA